MVDALGRLPREGHVPVGEEDLIRPAEARQIVGRGRSLSTGADDREMAVHPASLWICSGMRSAGIIEGKRWNGLAEPVQV